MRIKSWLKHAFAVEVAATPVSEAEMAVVEWICVEVVKRHMTTPALTFLEMGRPLNYLGSQTMQFFHPMLSAIADTADYETFAKFLARRDSIDILCRVIEKKEAEATKMESTLKQTNSDSK